MSAISFSFRPELIPAYAQAEFLTRVFQLVMDYQTLIQPVPVPDAPPADSVPEPAAFASVDVAEPAAFVAVDGDESAPVPAPKKQRKNPWADLSEEQRKERLDAMKRGRAAKKEARRHSEDSLEAAPAPAPAPAPAQAADDAVSETSSKKARKNPWADMTTEQKAARVKKMHDARMAKKAAAAAASGSDSA